MTLELAQDENVYIISKMVKTELRVFYSVTKLASAIFHSGFSSSQVQIFSPFKFKCQENLHQVTKLASAIFHSGFSSSQVQIFSPFTFKCQENLQQI